MKQTPTKKPGKLFWTFQPSQQKFLTHMLRLRLGNKAIMRRTGYSDHQITYAAHKYKVNAGMAVSLRQRWANGTDPLIDELLRDRAVVEAMDAEIDNIVTPKIIHPEAKVVRIKERPHPKVVALVRKVAAVRRVAA